MTGSFDGFSVLEPTDPAEIGRYRLYARLGAGGMGRVYLSTLPGGRPVALKVVHDGLAADPEFRRRFALEAQAAQQVNGIHIAQLLDVGADDPIPWLATAYIPGPSLLEAVRLQGPLPVETVRVLTAGVARALDAIHQAGLIHRDLKPANVILADDGPRVIDFGVARAADSTTGLTGGRVGSPQYMAPEQIRNQSATPALDVFALGALTFFAATGRPAFGEGEELAVLFRIVQEEPDLSECPQVVRDLVAACLAKEPERRPDLAAVIRYCEGENTAAGAGWLPPGIAEMARARVESSASLLAQAPTVRNAGAGSGAREAQAPVLAGGAGSFGGAAGAGVGGPAGVGGVGAPPAAAAAPAFGSATGPVPYPGSTTETLPPKAGWTTGKVVGLAAGAAVLAATVAIGATAMSGSGGGGKAAASGTTTPPAGNTTAPIGNVVTNSSATGTNTAPTSQATGDQTSSSSAGVPANGTGSDSADNTASSAPPPPANTAGPVSSGNDPVAWQGQMVFGADGIRLQKTAITYATGISMLYDLNLKADAHLPPGQFGFGDLAQVGKIIAWTGPNPPSRQDCVDTLNSNGGDSVSIPVGGLICVKGDSYQVAVVRIVAVDTSKEQATGKFVLWSQAMQ